MFSVYENHNINNFNKFCDFVPYTKTINNTPKTLNEIFKSRKFFINNFTIIIEYIEYIRKRIKWNYKNYLNNSINNNMKFNENYFPIRKDKLNFTEFGKLCDEDKLIYSKKTKSYNKPLISIIIHVFNRIKHLKKQ